MIIDFHSHFLPGIDDGSESNEMSFKMLEQSIDAGVTKIVATPHYYLFNKISIEDALIKRDKAYEGLIKHADSIGFEMPELYKGFEVHFDTTLKNLKNLDKLCIEGTNCLLIEMPYKKWDSELIEELYRLSIKGFRLIMAHVDRYYRMDKKSIYKLLELDVYYQVNAEMLENRGERKLLDSLIESGRLCVIGSDMHNVTDRATTIQKAYTIAQKKLKSDVQDLFYNNATKILSHS